MNFGSLTKWHSNRLLSPKNGGDTQYGSNYSIHQLVFSVVMNDTTTRRLTLHNCHDFITLAYTFADRLSIYIIVFQQLRYLIDRFRINRNQ